MRIGYETTLQKLNAQQGLPPVPFVYKPQGQQGHNQASSSGNSDTVIGGNDNGVTVGGSSSPVRSFSQAKHKIQ
jgi:hypothetical protein